MPPRKSKEVDETTDNDAAEEKAAPKGEDKPRTTDR